MYVHIYCFISGEESSEAMSSPEKSSPSKATTSTFDDEEIEPGEVPSVSSRFKEFQGIC